MSPTEISQIVDYQLVSDSSQRRLFSHYTCCIVVLFPRKVIAIEIQGHPNPMPVDGKRLWTTISDVTSRQRWHIFKMRSVEKCCLFELNRKLNRLERFLYLLDWLYKKLLSFSEIQCLFGFVKEKKLMHSRFSYNLHFTSSDERFWKISRKMHRWVFNEKKDISPFLFFWIANMYQDEEVDVKAFHEKK